MNEVAVGSGFPWWIMIIVVLLGVFAYLAFMIFLPEWVGITGKTALENQRSHAGEGDGERGGEMPAKELLSKEAPVSESKRD